MNRPAITALSLVTLSLAGCSSESAPEAELLTAPSRDGWSSDGPFPGFTLIGSLKSRRAHLVDMSGTSVHHWDTPEPPSGMYLTERGTLLRSLDADDKHPRFRAGGASGRIQEIDWDGSVVWDFTWDSEKSFYHHDMAEMPNGNLLIIAWDRYTREEALAAGRDPELLEGDELWPDAVYEIRPTRPVGGEVVWSWHSWDHLVQDFDPTAPNYADPATRPERINVNGDRNPDPPSDEEEAEEARRMAALGYGGGTVEEADGDADAKDGDTGAAPDGDKDKEEDEEEEDPEEAAIKKRIKDADWMHTNGIDYNAELDQIALSVRRYDEIWIIDHSTTTEEAKGSTGGRSGMGGDLLYRWGNPYAYGMGEFEDRRLLGQHNVQWIPEGHLGAGNLIVFNNGTKQDRAWSTIDEWWAPRDSLGRYVPAIERPFGPEELEWTYAAEEPEDFFSSFISGVQRLPNGNTLVCSGAQGWVFEVTPAGEVVWDWKNPFGIDPEVDEPDDPESSFNPRALFRADRYAPDHPGIVALRAKGASIPLDPGTGPATNQYVEPVEDDAEEED